MISTPASVSPGRHLALPDPRAELDLQAIGSEMHAAIADLYPLCRSITGDGVRATLRYLSRFIPLQIREVPSGTRVFDWTIPDEWAIRDAYIKDSRGERVVDFARSNLHVVHYSVPVDRRMRLHELREHLFTLPGHLDWIPYRTSYYRKAWGFCLSHRDLLRLSSDEEYEVRIDSSLQPGHMSYGEYYLPGQREEEVLISTHGCHPSLCDDNLSGVVATAFLARHLSQYSTRYSYRFLFIPGTIGAIAWLSLNESRAPLIRHGVILRCLGNAGPLTYTRSRRGAAEIDRILPYALRARGGAVDLLDFALYGDERQFSSPAFDLPIGCLTRSPDGSLPEHHTSADDLGFVRAEALADSFAACVAGVETLDANRRYVTLNPKCEPQLAPRGLSLPTGGTVLDDRALRWVLNLSDGLHSVVDIAERSGCSFGSVATAASVLHDHGLLREVAS